jgi:hypothetical protein
MHDNERIPASAEADAAVLHAAEIKNAPNGVASDAFSEASEAEGIESGSLVTQPQEEQHETETEKENEMIDVHAPHGGIHTWRDFWIHLGTIALGLLIAISLEQSAEWLHHLHQRHQLEDALRAEGLRNRDYAAVDIAVNEKVIAWLLELQRGVDGARAGGGKTAFVYPPRADGTPDSPRYVAYHMILTEAWTTAQASSLVALLPREQAEIYAHLNFQTQQVAETRERVRLLGEQQGAFETRFSHGTYPPDIDLAGLTPQQLDEYEAVLASELEAVHIGQARLRIFAAANEYVLSGGVGESGFREAILRANMPQ